MKHILKLLLFVTTVFYFAGISLMGVSAQQNPEFTQEEQEYIALKPVIYVVGNKDRYPAEYYISGSKEYAGIVPDYLRLVEEQTGIRFRYIEYGEGENILKLGLNNQAEIVTAVVENTSKFTDYGLEQGAYIMQIPVDGHEETMYLSYTSIANPRLISVVEKCIASISQEQKESIYYMNAQRHHYSYGRYTGYSVILLGVLLLLVIMATYRSYRRWKKISIHYKYCDSITGGMNYSYLKDRYKKLPQGERNNYWFLCIDLGIQNITRVYGYVETKEILKTASGILTDVLGSDECFARLDGNVFLILLKCYTEKELISRIKNRLHELSKSMDTGVNVHELDVHMGIYSLKQSDEDLKKPLRYAMLAQRNAKTNNIRLITFDSNMEKKISEEADLEQDVQNALNYREFAVYFQPFYKLKDNTMTGCEALVRWEHPTKGLLSPSHFIPVVEKLNLLKQLDLYMFDMVCGILKNRKEQKKELFIVSCNFDRQNFTDSGFADRLIRTAFESGIPPEYLAIEITEGLSLRNNPNTGLNIDKLSKAGFQLVIDNFGSEYAAFPDLIRYSINIVKIDNKLIDHLNSEKMIMIINGLVLMMHQLGIKVMCRGVEKEEQESRLRELDCDLAQGYFFYRPMDAAEFERLID